MFSYKSWPTCMVLLFNYKWKTLLTSCFVLHQCYSLQGHNSVHTFQRDDPTDELCDADEASSMTLRVPSVLSVPRRFGARVLITNPVNALLSLTSRDELNSYHYSTVFSEFLGETRRMSRADSFVQPLQLVVCTVLVSRTCKNLD